MSSHPESHALPSFPGMSQSKTSRSISLRALQSVFMSIMSLKFSRQAKSLSTLSLIFQSFWIFKCFRNLVNVDEAFKVATDEPTRKDKFVYVLLYSIALVLYMWKLASVVLPVHPYDWVPEFSNVVVHY
ncbi:hypothetical protein P9112_002855 [Eukaryota sp. TZLM1-RC]